MQCPRRSRAIGSAPRRCLGITASEQGGPPPRAFGRERSIVKDCFRPRPTGDPRAGVRNVGSAAVDDIDGSGVNAGHRTGAHSERDPERQTPVSFPVPTGCVSMGVPDGLFPEVNCLHDPSLRAGSCTEPEAMTDAGELAVLDRRTRRAESGDSLLHHSGWRDRVLLADHDERGRCVGRVVRVAGVGHDQGRWSGHGHSSRPRRSV
jgi:hypothetical protein